MMSKRLIVVAVLALSGLPGCRVYEKLTKERSPADTASRTKDKDKDKDWLKDRQRREPADPPKDWLSGPAPEGRGNRVPPADNWADPASRGFDARNASSRTLSGSLEDADGRALPNTYITVENADPLKAGYGAPMGVESDRDGFFEMNGLTAGEHYMLSAQVNRNGKPQAGRLSVQVPNAKVRLRLKEDFQLPAGRSRESGDLPPSVPSAGALPPKVFDAPAPSVERSPDWSPLGPGTPKPAEIPRGDLVAPGSQPDWRTPPANIPGPASPTVPAPPLLGPTSRALPRAATLAALGGDGRTKLLLSGRAEDLVLLDFLTTTCGPCKKAVPTLVTFHDRHGQRVELIAVVCDPGSDSRRVSLARTYQDQQRLPYAVVAESTREPLQDTFDVQSYPTLVLIDGTGRRLWKGHPKDLSEVERIIRER